MIDDTQQGIDDAVHACLQFVNAKNATVDPGTRLQNAFKVSQIAVNAFSSAPILFHLRILKLVSQHKALSWLTTVDCLLLLTRMHNFSDSLVQHYLCGILNGILIAKNNDPRTRAQLAKAFLKQANSARHEVIREGIIVSLKPHQTNNGAAINQLVSAACQLANIWQKHEAMTTANLLKSIGQLVRRVPDLQPPLAPLLQLSSPIWQGMLLRFEDAPYCVAGVHDGDVILIKIAKPSDHPIDLKRCPSSDFFKYAISDKTVSGATFTTFLTRLHETKPNMVAGLLTQPSYAIQRPPAELIVILDRLKRPSSEPSDIADLIDQSPLFGEILSRSATQLNRQNIAVSNIRQSVMTHGLERISAVLTEHILWQRLTLKQFPLRARFMTLSELHRSISAMLAEQCKIGLAQQFSLMALLQLSGLFTSAKLRTLITWQPNHTPRRQLDGLFEQSSVNLNEQANSLAKAWLLSPQMSNVFGDVSLSNRESRLYADVLNISLHLAMQWLYFPDQSFSSVFDWFDEQCKRIHLTPDIVHNICNATAEQRYCPLYR